MLHQSSHGVFKIALLIDATRVGNGKYAPTPSSRAALALQCVVDVTFESKAPVMFSKGIYMQYGKPRSIPFPNGSNALSKGSVSNFLSFDNTISTAIGVVNVLL